MKCIGARAIVVDMWIELWRYLYIILVNTSINKTNIRKLNFSLVYYSNPSDSSKAVSNSLSMNSSLIFLESEWEKESVRLILKI